MKPALLSCLALLANSCVFAQFSLLPQVGFEQARTSLGFNSLTTSDVASNLRASLRADFRFKGGHGPFINMGTNPAPVSFAFRNDGTLDAAFPKAANSLQFRMEAGYQYTTKPIQLKKGAAAIKSTTSLNNRNHSVQRKSCGSASYRPHCGDKKTTMKQAPVNKALNIQLQPSLGLAYLSANNSTVVQHANGYQYSANAWKTALVPSMGVVFGKGQKQLFTLTAFYTRPLDLRSEEVASMSGSKPVVTTMHPKASAWGMTLGVPISLAKKPAVQKSVKPVMEERQQIKHYQYKKCSGAMRL